MQCRAFGVLQLGSCSRVAAVSIIPGPVRRTASQGRILQTKAGGLSASPRRRSNATPFSTALQQPMVRQLFTEPDCSSQHSQEQTSHLHPQPNQSRSHFFNIFIIAMSTAGTATWLWAGRSGVLLHCGAGDFSQFQNVLHALRTAQPSVEWVLGLFSGVKTAGTPS